VSRFSFGTTMRRARYAIMASRFRTTRVTRAFSQHMAFVDRLPRFARLEFLGKHQARGRLVAVGFLAGFALFLLWWAFQPPVGVRPGIDAATAGTASTQPAIGGTRGVLDGITGAPGPMRGELREEAPEDEGASTSFEDVAVPDDEAGIAPPDDAALADAMPEEGVPPPAETGDVAMPMPAAPDAPALRPWYVEVEAADGVAEQLRVDATSAEQALAILRDYRGDPRVLRGPSPQPLE
jgi:hypothetical protein